MEELLSGLRAAAEATRVRILFLLSHGEANVSELTQILGQSQPRVSRHLKLMAEAGLISRHKEGNWVLFRLCEEHRGGALARAIVDLLPGGDSVLSGDLARLEDIRSRRAEAAARYFRDNARQWEQLRSLHVQEEDVEQAMVRLAGSRPIRLHADLGTGTGAVLRRFTGIAAQSIGIDSSREMLAIARVNLEKAGLRHAQVRHAEIYALPFPDGFADFITIHQVLHFLDEPGRALAEAARILEPGGRLLIVDFAPHDLEELRQNHAHRRLGLSSDDMAHWLNRSGLTLAHHQVLPPPSPAARNGLTVSLWLATAPTTSATEAPNRSRDTAT